MLRHAHNTNRNLLYSIVSPPVSDHRKCLSTLRLIKGHIVIVEPYAADNRFIRSEF